MYGSTGSFAKGFVQAFLAAQRLAMEERHWKLIDENQRLINQQLLHGSPGTQAFEHGVSQYRNHQPANGDSSGASSRLTPNNIDPSIPPEGRALLATIGGPESDGSYNARYPSKTFDDLSDHPRIAEKITSGPNAGKTSDAAGRYQFLSSTWDTERAKLGLKDFSSASQDKAAWDLAQSAYKTNTGGDLLAALKSGDPKQLAGVSKALGGTWTSLPGAIEAGTNQPAFIKNYQTALTSQITPDAAGEPKQLASAIDSTPGVPDTYTANPVPGKSYRPSQVPPGTVFGQAAPEAHGAPIGATPPTTTQDVLQDNAEGAAKQGWGPSPLGLPIPTSDAGQQALPLGADQYAYAPMDDYMALPFGDEYFSARGGLVPRVKRYDDGGLVDDNLNYDAGDDSLSPTDATMDGNDSALPISDASFNSPMSRLQSQARGEVRVRPSTGASTLGGGRSMRRSPSLRGVDQGPVPEGFGVTVPQFTDGEGGVSDGLAGAIQGGVSFLAKLVGGGALPSDESQHQGRQVFHGGATSMSPEQIEQVSRAANSDGGLDDHMAHAAGLQMMHEFYRARGDNRSADAATGAMLKGLQEQSSKLAAKAVDQYTRGDYEGAARALENAYGYIPDLHSVEIRPQKDGYAIVTQKDAQGKVTKQLELSPQQLLGAAVGLKNGPLFWQALNDEIAPKTSASQQFSPEDQKAFDEVTGGGKPAPAGQTAQAPAQPATSGQPPAQAGALPIAPADAQAPTPDASAPETAPPEATSAQAPSPPPSSPQTMGAVPLGSAANAALQNDTALRVSAYHNYGVELRPPANFTATPSNFAHMTPKGQTALRQWQKQQLMEWNKENGARRTAAEKYITDQILQARQTKSNENITDRQEKGANYRLMQGDYLQKQNAASAAERAKELEAFKSEQTLRHLRNQADMPTDPTREGTNMNALAGSGGDDILTHATKLLPTIVKDFTQRFSPEQQDALAQHATDIGLHTKGANMDFVIKTMNKIISPEQQLKDKKTSAGLPEHQQEQDSEAFNTEYNADLKVFRLTMPNGQRLMIPLDTMNSLLAMRAQEKSAYRDTALTNESKAAQDSKDYAQGRILTKRILDRADQPQAIPQGGW